MNTAIDFGNTKIKVGHFIQNELTSFFVLDTIDELILNLKQAQPSKIIIGTVTNIAPETIHIINEMAPVVLFLNNIPIPIKNKYQSTASLGSDRLAAAIGANYFFPNRNILIIDAGTCIKYNFVNDKNEFLGGGISPGLQMRFKALNQFTAKLPLVDYDEKYQTLIGTSTIDSIRMGVQLGTIAELEGVIAQYIEKFHDINIVLTGGDTSVLQKGLKNDIFADPFLILKGLNCVLNYQNKKYI